ncbi:MAG: putative sugar O-methyltransferase, partial [Candidatus Zixiibacteriota bacterium]
MEKMSDAIFHEAQEYYQKVTSLYAQNKYEQSYELGNIWLRNNNTEISEIVKSSKNAIDAIHKIQDTWLYSVNVSDKVKENAVDWLLDNQKRSGFDLFKTAAKFQESKYSNPDNNVVRNNRILTPDFLRITSYLNQMKRFCKMPKSKFAALELGAGCGHLARVMKLAYSHCSYVIIDIPETLIFSYMFLRLNFPKAKTLYVACEEDIDSQYLNDFDFVFVPTMFAEKILNIKYHLFINTASMGEMNNKIIRYWMGYVQNKLKVDYLFTFNRYLNSILVDGSMDWRLNENECSVHYDSNWDILNWELEPSYSQCPFVDTIITRNVEIVAQKTPPLTLKQKKSKSKRLYLDVMDEDWVRISKSFSAIMTKGDNLLNNDLSMSGTLFKLWDSIRYEPNENNVALILRYLARLLNRWDIEFEEV